MIVKGIFERNAGLDIISRVEKKLDSIAARMFGCNVQPIQWPVRCYKLVFQEEVDNVTMTVATGVVECMPLVLQIVLDRIRLQTSATNLNATKCPILLAASIHSHRWWFFGCFLSSKST